MSGISIGPLTIHTYGLLIGLGIYLGVWEIERIVSRRNLSFRKEDVWDGLLYAVVSGVMGARIYHVVDLWEYYQSRPWQSLAIWNGGLGIYGAIIGGVLGLALYAKRKGFVLWEMLDLAAIAMPLGQAIGRWGNYFNQELYGKPTTLPWGIKISGEHLLSGFSVNQRFHPIFLYESIMMLITFVILRYRVLPRVRIGRGYLICLYMIAYGLARMGLETLRINPWTVWGVPMAIVISFVMIMIGIGGILYVKKSA